MSGSSEGEYISLGRHEMDDLVCVASHSQDSVGGIGLESLTNYTLRYNTAPYKVNLFTDNIYYRNQGILSMVPL